MTESDNVQEFVKVYDDSTVMDVPCSISQSNAGLSCTVSLLLYLCSLSRITTRALHFSDISRGIHLLASSDFFPNTNVYCILTGDVSVRRTSDRSSIRLLSTLELLSESSKIREKQKCQSAYGL